MSSGLDYLRDRQRAYQLAFSNQKLVLTLKEAYLELKGSPAGNMVLQDLTRFCRAIRPCYDVDPRYHLLLEGRREVFLRITEHMHMSLEQLQALYDRRNILTPSEDDNA